MMKYLLVVHPLRRVLEDYSEVIRMRKLVRKYDDNKINGEQLMSGIVHLQNRAYDEGRKV